MGRDRIEIIRDYLGAWNRDLFTFRGELLCRGDSFFDRDEAVATAESRAQLLALRRPPRATPSCRITSAPTPRFRR